MFGYWASCTFTYSRAECAGVQFCLRIMSVGLLDSKRVPLLRIILRPWAINIKWDEQYKCYFFISNGKKPAAEIIWMCKYFLQCQPHDLHLLYYSPGKVGTDLMAFKYTLWTIDDVGM